MVLPGEFTHAGGFPWRRAICPVLNVFLWVGGACFRKGISSESGCLFCRGTIPWAAGFPMWMVLPDDCLQPHRTGVEQAH
jgi:hypothetical protein